MKLLLYCTKAKPYIMKYKDGKYKEIASFYNKQDLANYDLLNGKIVAECDFEVERITYNYLGNPFYDFYGMQLHTKTLKEYELSQLSKINSNELRKYLLRTEDDFIIPLEVGYAIHIKNLHIFEEPRELSECHYLTLEKGFLRQIKKAPQNMCYALTTRDDKNILISIQPQWLCKILNGEKTIEVRKKVLKEMLK